MAKKKTTKKSASRAPKKGASRALTKGASTGSELKRTKAAKKAPKASKKAAKTLTKGALSGSKSTLTKVANDKRPTVRKGVGPSKAKQERGGAKIEEGKHGSIPSGVGRAPIPGGVRKPTRSGQRNWKPPADMPKAFAKKVLAGKCCGAKLRGQRLQDAIDHGEHGYCQDPPYEYGKHRNIPYRCHSHGGASPGAPLGNIHGLKHGMYVQALLDGEDLSDAEVGSLDDEIKLQKLRLARALRAEAEVIDAKRSGDIEALKLCMEIKSDTSTYEIDPETLLQKGSSFIEKNIPDWGYRIDRILRTLVRLESQRLAAIVAGQAAGGDGTHTPEEKAAMARQFLKEARDVDLGGTLPQK